MAARIEGKVSVRLLAEEAVERALRAGATDAEAVGFESEEFAAHIRLGQVEQLTESGSHALGAQLEGSCLRSSDRLVQVPFNKWSSALVLWFPS